MLVPFGQTLKLWRLRRGLTQTQLARAAGVPRPNLSAIERGKREVSLSTLRALALALDIRPGVLADGESPAPPVPPSRLTREVLERVVEAVVRRTRLKDPAERGLARLLAPYEAHRRLLATKRRGVIRGHARAAEAARLTLRAAYPPALARLLFERIDDRYRFHEPKAD
jgi:transcriptional regulator with XRE-family HTH domain